MPDLIDDIRNIAARIEKSKDIVATEEATKNAFIMPFIAALGYDVFDPTEVTVPATVTILAGQTTATFNVNAVKSNAPRMIMPDYTNASAV